MQKLCSTKIYDKKMNSDSVILVGRVQKGAVRQELIILRIEFT